MTLPPVTEVLGQLQAMPDKIAKVFLLRELDDLSTEEICSTLAITPGNLWVMLHRARMALRRCLETNWFAKHTGGQGAA